MIFSGHALNVEQLASGTAHLVFDLQDSSVNKFDRQTLDELKAAIASVQESEARGLIFSSAKSSFIVGADIAEFTAMFKQTEDEIATWIEQMNGLFNAIEDLNMPTVCAIDGNALGGGFELVLATDFRVATAEATVGLPEVKLGIMPGFGGSVRLPRLIGADNANQWISSGAHIGAEQAFKEGALDAIVQREQLIPAAESLIEQCIAGKLDTQPIRRRKVSPLLLTPIELNVAYETAKALVVAEAGPHYPAPVTAVDTMHRGASLDRAGALKLEHQAFAKLATTDVAANLVQMFLNDQYISAKAKKFTRETAAVSKAAVLGAGIMGGGIAYQSALRGTPVVMKDVNQEGIDAGMGEATKQLRKRVERGKLDMEDMLSVLTSIKPTLDYGGFEAVDIVVEAVVENAQIKQKVLAEVEDRVGADTVIASNTSTISIDELAVALQRPERFCGMHFFNPVPVMPLVEVIRGEKTSAEAIAATVAFARKMGKKPIVVRNCPGFLVNRILFPYFGAFNRLLHDGADYRQVDKAMERFGWPMGPAYLLDVIGLDTAVHAQKVMASGYERMQQDFTSAIEVLFSKKQLGQKTGSGFYRYEMDKRGKPRKLPHPEVEQLLAESGQGSREIEPAEVVERMMLAMCLETVRCLEEGVVDSAIEADMGLVLGLGFPPFRGGALRYIDSLGLNEFCALAGKYESLGSMYEIPGSLRERAEQGQLFYPDHGSRA